MKGWCDGDEEIGDGVEVSGIEIRVCFAFSYFDRNRFHHVIYTSTRSINKWEKRNHMKPNGQNVMHTMASPLAKRALITCPTVSVHEKKKLINPS